MDTIRAFLGPKHCGWCDDHGATWWDRLMRFDQAMKTVDRPLHERIAMKVDNFFLERVGFWKIGQRWHFKHHEGRY